MTDISAQDPRTGFATAAKEWLCDAYCVEYRYVARSTEKRMEIVHAMVVFYPWMNKDQDASLFNFHTEAGDFTIGQLVRSAVTLVEATEALENALAGQINLPNRSLALPGDGESFHYLRGDPRNPWVNMLHASVSVSGSQHFAPPPTLDDDLRRARVPFDGYSDVLSWLTLNEFRHPAGVPSLAILPLRS
jgi:hypothetical protein